jgi:hypothetical protein
VVILRVLLPLLEFDELVLFLRSLSGFSLFLLFNLVFSFWIFSVLLIHLGILLKLLKGALLKKFLICRKLDVLGILLGDSGMNIKKGRLVKG